MSILSPNSHLLYRELNHRDLQQPQQPNWSNGCCSTLTKTCAFGFDRRKDDQSKRIAKRDCKVAAFWDKPAFVEMEPITDSDHLDTVLEQAKQASQPIVIDWMAAWCRKCIYLKPKLEKLAADYDTKLKFYCVDVNKVPQALVKRGKISKMPTIQLWKDGEMKAEVIGGHKAWLVLEEVREMIKNFVEAYRSNDSACHGRAGVTSRTAPLFGPGGHAYVYLCYGLHTMLNVVADKQGIGSAVLIRSCAPIAGLETIKQRRGLDTEKPVLLTGPGKVGQALGISKDWSNQPLFTPGGLELLDGPDVMEFVVGPRVGIDYALPEHVAALWRFAIAGSPWISAPKNTLNLP